MAIKAADVKKLRDLTGVGMMASKKALVEADGDIDKAIEILRENGQATAEKKSSRIAAEGLVKVLVSDDAKRGVAVEVNSETDFVAENEKFQNYVADVANQVMASKAEDMESFMAEPWNKDESKTVQEALVEQISVISENLKIRRFDRVREENGFITSYTHMVGKIGVLVDVETDVNNEAIQEMARNVAMQITAMRPKYLDRTEVPGDFLAKEEEILRAAIANDPVESKKPEKVIEGMVKGRIQKELKEICLMDQIYVKAEDGKQSVQKYIEQVAKENQAKVRIRKFIRYETGEGIEKRNDDFAAEVAAQASGN